MVCKKREFPPLQSVTQIFLFFLNQVKFYIRKWTAYHFNECKPDYVEVSYKGTGHVLLTFGMWPVFILGTGWPNNQKCMRLHVCCSAVFKTRVKVVESVSESCDGLCNNCVCLGHKLHPHPVTKDLSVLSRPDNYNEPVLYSMWRMTPSLAAGLEMYHHYGSTSTQAMNFVLGWRQLNVALL